MMDCVETKNQFSSYLDDQLSELDKKQFLIHLENCPSCCRELQLWQTISTLCRDVPEVELPAQFSSSLHQKLLLAKEEMVQQNNVQENTSKQKEISEIEEPLPAKIKHKWIIRQYITLAAGLVLFVGVSWYGADAFLSKSGTGEGALLSDAGRDMNLKSAGTQQAASDTPVNSSLPVEAQGTEDQTSKTFTASATLTDQDAMKSATSHYVYSMARDPAADTLIANRSGESMLAAGLGETEDLAAQAALDYEIIDATIILPSLDAQTVVTKAYELAKTPGIEFVQILTDQNAKMTGLLVTVPKEQLDTFIRAWQQFATDVQYTEQKENISSEYNQLLQEKENLAKQGEKADQNKLQEVTNQLKQWGQRINYVSVTIQIAS